MEMSKLGSYAFIIGVVIAILAGIGAAGILGGLAVWVPLLLVILGLLVGYLNITDKETDKFLIAGIALVVLGTTAQGLAVIPSIGIYMAGIVEQVAIFVAPAALIVGLKSIYGLAKD